MRLSDNESQIIIAAFRKNFGEEDHLWLFGSRTDDTKRGGDIDLYIETIENDVTILYDQKVRFVSDL